MTLTLTYSEFNRRRSEALRTARGGEDVIVVPARGDARDSLLLTRLDKAMNPVDRAIAEGKMAPPKATMAQPLLVADVGAGAARRALDSLDAERAPDA